MAVQWDMATEDEITQHCLRSNLDRDDISEIDGLSIARISEDKAVKRGFGLSQVEVVNQQLVYENLNEAIIRIPQVYCFFVGKLDDYLKEYINGQTVSSMADPDTYLEPMAWLLELSGQVKKAKSEPFHGCVAFGKLW